MSWLAFRLAFTAGKDALEKGDWALAERELEKSLRQKPGQPDASLALVEAQLKLGKKEEAKSNLQEMIAPGRSAGFAHFLLGNLHAASGEMEEACACYRDSATLDPKNSEAWNGLGKTSIKLGKYMDAVESFQRVASLEPYMASSRLGELKEKLVRDGILTR